MLRMESANQEIDGRPLPPLGEDARPKFKQGFDLLKTWVEENLDLYKVRVIVFKATRKSIRY